MTSRGIVISGRVLPHTERVLREPGVEWTRGRDTRPRQWPVDLLVGHWTGGPPRTGPGAGRAVFRAMNARKRDDGTDLSVSVHFVISWDGLIWQLLDLAEAAVHVGSREVNARSIGVECCWPGLEVQARKLGVEGLVETRTIGTARVKCLRPSDELIDAWRWLADTLTSADADLSRVQIPRRCAPLSRRLSKPEMTRFAGVCEHYHTPGTTKLDAAGYLVESLGWPST